MGLPDAYVLRARIAPVTLAALPVIVVFLADLVWLDDLGELTFAGILGLAVLTLLAQLGRDRGKRLEPALFRSWGGPPTTRLLRHRDDTFDPITKQRLHATLERKSGVVLLTAEEEAEDPAGADMAYGSAVLWLLRNAPDKRSAPHLWEDNVSYGFRRNLWALKPFALAICLALVVLAIWTHWPLAPTGINALLLDPALVSGVAGFGAFAAFVTRCWVRSAADAYAYALINTVERL